MNSLPWGDDNTADTTTPQTVFWLSRHALSSAQTRALHELHGPDVRIETAAPVFVTADGLADFIRAREGAWVYAVAGPPHYLVAGFAGLRFGVFENHPQKRGDDVTFICEGRLGLALAVLYLQAFERETTFRADELGGAVSACAGVAIVSWRNETKSHGT